MNDYLKRFEKLLNSKNEEKLKSLMLEVRVSIENYAEVVDYLKRQHFSWNKRCEELCTIRDMITKQMKGNNDEN